ncbi:MAG: hypothetical protein ACYTG2_07500 [Planctomycetota bacterium]|jgi:hypothetical protein
MRARLAIARPPARRASAGRAWGAVATLVALLCLPARAHVPHEIAWEVAVSPDFATDGTVMAWCTLQNHNAFARSTDGGQSWQEYGLAMVSDAITQIVFSPDFATDGTVFASTGQGGVWRSTDRGDSWSQANAGLASLTVTALAASPDFATDACLLALTPAGPHRSADGGETWAPAGVGLVEPVPVVAAFAAADGGVPALFAGRLVLHRSDDLGLSWQPVGTLPLPMAALAVSPHFATDATLATCFGRFGNGVMLSVDAGQSFADMNSGLTDPFVAQVRFADDASLFAVTNEDGCFLAPPGLSGWTQVSSGFKELSEQTAEHYYVVAPSPQFSADGTAFVAGFEGLYRTVDGAQSWAPTDISSHRTQLHVQFAPGWPDDPTFVTNTYGCGPVFARVGGIPPAPPPGTGAGAGLSPRGAALADSGAGGAPTPAAWSGASGGTPGGEGTPPFGGAALHFEARSSGIASQWSDALRLSPAYAVDHTVYYGDVGLWRSTDRGRSWTALPIPVALVRDVVCSPDFATDRTLVAASNVDGLWRSTDAGDTWVSSSAGLPVDVKTAVMAISPGAPFDGTVFLGTANAGLWRSTDGGLGWSDASVGLTGPSVRAIALSPEFPVDQTMFCGLVGEGVFRSTDGGDTWAPQTAGLPTGVPRIVEAIACSPQFSSDGTVFLTLYDDGVFRSTDGGLSWVALDAGLALTGPRALAVSPDYGTSATLLLGTHDWVWASSDAGETWTRLPGSAHVDDDHQLLRYDGTWTDVEAPGQQGTGYARSEAAGGWTELRFRGVAVSWDAPLGPGFAEGEVWLDGVPVARVDLSSPTLEPSRAVWSASFASQDWHTVRVVHVGAGGKLPSDGFTFRFGP